MKLIFMTMQLPIFKELEVKTSCSINHGYFSVFLVLCLLWKKQKICINYLVLIILEFSFHNP